MQGHPRTTWGAAVAGSGLLIAWARDGLEWFLSPGPDGTGIGGVSAASAAGSELPWWSPLAVSVILLALAAVERGRRRGRGQSPPHLPEQLFLWDASGRPWWKVPPSTPGGRRPRYQGVLSIGPAALHPPA